jgi:hypothetical protein
MHPFLKKLWQDMWGDLTLGETALVMEHILLERGLSEMDAAAMVGKHLGNVFKARENLTDLFAKGAGPLTVTKGTGV